MVCLVYPGFRFLAFPFCIDFPLCPVRRQSCRFALCRCAWRLALRKCTIRYFPSRQCRNPKPVLLYVRHAQPAMLREILMLHAGLLAQVVISLMVFQIHGMAYSSRQTNPPHPVILSKMSYRTYGWEYSGTRGKIRQKLPVSGGAEQRRGYHTPRRKSQFLRCP